MIRIVAAAVLGWALLTPATAVADPNNLVPNCSGQVAEPGQCNATPESANPLDGVFGDAAGGNPNVQVGLTPQNQPVLLPLGVLPGNLPVVFPLGVTPPNVVAGR